MNQKDYKELARIIRERFIFWKDNYSSVGDKHRIQAQLECKWYANLFADYFERRQKVIFGDDDFSFDRKQFLEWCGCPE